MFDNRKLAPEIRARIEAFAKVRNPATKRKRLTSFLLDPIAHKRLSKTAFANGISLGSALREAVNPMA
jgi:hypothetical protein